MYSSNKEVTKVFREVVIREQLIKMLKDIEYIDIIFCAFEMSKQIDGYHSNPVFEGGKC
tara:strand:+ start:481 stop:657 length:177 start_codon:yes stop_codon:yes gene_type:complete